MHLVKPFTKLKSVRKRYYCTVEKPKTNVKVKVVDVSEFTQNIESLDLKYKPLTTQILEERQVEQNIPWWRRSWFKKRSVGEYEFIRLPKSDETQNMKILRDHQREMDKLRFRQETSWVWKPTKLFYNDAAHLDIHGSTMWCLTKEHAERIEWRTLELPSTFNSWFVLSMAHVWMLYVRSRKLENKEHEDLLMQRIVDDFFYDVDRGIVLCAGITNVSIVSRSSKQYFDIYGGSLFAYDEAFARNDRIFADALFRNVFSVDPSIATPRKLASLVEYIRKNLQMLDELNDKEFITTSWRWLDPPNLSE